jgi:Tfp pilus assembly pilus retraction ATPase PilT
MNKLLRLARKIQVSDFYLHAGSPPLMRVGGVTRATDLRELSEQDLERLLAPLLFAEQQRLLDQREEVAFTYSCEEGNLFSMRASKKSGQLRISAHRV